MVLIINIRLYLLLFFLVNTSLFSQADNYKIITPDNENIQYSGRIDSSNPLQPYLSWPASAIDFTFTGNYLALTINDDKGDNYYNIFLDDEPYPFVLNCEKGKKTYLIYNKLQDKPHKIKVYKRTDGRYAGSTFINITLAKNGTLLPSIAKPKRKIEFYGDSITTGMANEAPYFTNEENPEYENNYLSYAAISARELNAQYHVISHSGIGIMTSWYDFIMPGYFDQLSAVGDNNSQWSFNKWLPDIVVVNLFQNDFSLIQLRGKIKPMPTDTDITQAYIDFIATLQSKYPKANFVSALGSMNVTDKNSQWPSYVKSAVTQLKQRFPNNKFTFVEFSYTGRKGHPRVQNHVDNAKKLSQAIKKITDW